MHQGEVDITSRWPLWQAFGPRDAVFPNLPINTLRVAGASNRRWTVAWGLATWEEMIRRTWADNAVLTNAASGTKARAARTCSAGRSCAPKTREGRSRPDGWRSAAPAAARPSIERSILWTNDVSMVWFISKFVWSRPKRRVSSEKVRFNHTHTLHGCRLPHGPTISIALLPPFPSNARV